MLRRVLKVLRKCDGQPFLVIKEYQKALETLEVGIKYCEARDLDFLTYYMLSCKSRVLFETGKWKESEFIARQLLTDRHHVLVKLVVLGVLSRLGMRHGKIEEARRLIAEAKELAKNTHELQRIIPIITAELELAWLTSSEPPRKEVAAIEATYFQGAGSSWYYSELMYWKKKCGIIPGSNPAIAFVSAYKPDLEGDWVSAAEAWKRLECPYEHALCLMEGDEEDQRQGLQQLGDLGAVATVNMLKGKLKIRGIRNIPRGPRETTLNNPGQLTDRQIDILTLLHDGYW